MFSSMSFSRHAEGHAIIYTSRYIDDLFDFFLDSAFSMTFLAGIVYFYPCSRTLITDNGLLHNAKYTPRCSCDVARTVTRTTFFRLLPIFCSVSMTRITVHHFIKMYFFFYPRKTLCKRYVNFFLNIFTTFISCLSTIPSETSHISKNRRKNILDVDISKIKSPHTAKTTIAPFS